MKENTKRKYWKMRAEIERFSKTKFQKMEKDRENDRKNMKNKKKIRL